MEKRTQSFSGLSRAITLLGSKAGVVRAIAHISPKITVQHVTNWMHRDQEGAPVKVCTALEAATTGQITRQELRPDDWFDIWPELQGSDQSSSSDRTSI